MKYLTHWDSEKETLTDGWENDVTIEQGDDCIIAQVLTKNCIISGFGATEKLARESLYREIRFYLSTTPI